MIKAEKKTTRKIACCIMTRTVGYYANFHNMNGGKQEEVRNRKLYDVKKIPEVIGATT